MMATTLEISFLKQDDKNYFIYPFLCYNEIFCIFYRFYRINIEMWYFFLAHSVLSVSCNFSWVTGQH